MIVNNYELLERPGYFGRKRDEKIKYYNRKYGEGNWELKWYVPSVDMSFSTMNYFVEPALFSYTEACQHIYELSYMKHFLKNPAVVDWVCQYKECIDNAETNVNSGCDYNIQEAYSTHIQDIAVRNCLVKLNKSFTGKIDRLLVIRGEFSEGFRLNPGQIPVYTDGIIYQPSKSPEWAKKGSVEDFWQSNKFICKVYKNIISGV